MSDYEGHRGKLVPTDLDPLRLMEDVGFEPYKGDPLEVSFNDCFYDGDYVMLNDIVYRVHNTEYDDTERMSATIENDGSITYDVYFYNGGCGFTEALEEAINKAKERD